MKVLNSKRATELAQKYKVSFSPIIGIEVEPHGTKLPCYVTVPLLQRMNFDGDLVILKKRNLNASWVIVTEECKPVIDNETNRVTFFAETFS